MLASNIPTKLPIPWGSSAGGSFIRAIPVASQIGIVAGAASLADGFVPLNATPIESGGIPPDIRDMNGALFEISGWSRWQQAGGPIYYDGAFATAIGGYPSGAVVQSAATPGKLWLCTADNNVTDPDGGSPANWQAIVPVPATLAEVVAGTNGVKFVTPLTLAEWFAGLPPAAPYLVAYSYGTSGYEEWSNGKIEQWVRVGPFGPGSRAFSWPIPFTSAIWNLQVSISNGLSFSGSASGYLNPLPNLSGGTAWTNNGAGAAMTLDIRAIGR